MSWQTNGNTNLFGQMNAWGAPAFNTGYDQMGGGMAMTEQLQGIDPALQNRMVGAQLGNFEASTANLNRQNQPLTGWAKGAQTFGTVAQGLAGLGSMYLGYKGMKEQKKMNKFNMGITNTNMNNSIMDYNRRLADTLGNRALNNGQGQGWVSDQLSKYSAKRTP